MSIVREDTLLLSGKNAKRTLTAARRLSHSSLEMLRLAELCWARRGGGGSPLAEKPRARSISPHKEETKSYFMD